jgi:hypothetical protein
MSCVFCGLVIELMDYLFVTCSSVLVWYIISRWLGFALACAQRILGLFDCCLGVGVGMRDRS